MIRLQAQTRVIRFINGVLCCVLGLCLGLMVVATALPQKRMLADKQSEYTAILQQEAGVLATKQDKQASLDALRMDREYLELHARDRLNLHRPGEKIYRIESDH